MTIRKAVIPAGGLGSRFLPITKALPKEMLPIVDVPAIQFVVEEAIAAGIDSILIVTNSHKRMLEDYFDKSLELERLLEDQGKHDLSRVVREISSMVDIHFIRQKEPLGLGHALLCARQFVDGEPFAVLLPDELIQSDPPCLAEMKQVYEQFSTSVVAVQKVPFDDVERYGIIAPSTAFELQNIRLQMVDDVIEKPSRREAPSNCAVVGRYILEPEVLDILQGIAPGRGGEIQLADALRAHNEHHQMMALEVCGKRYDIGNKLGYLQACLDYALDRDDLNVELSGYLHSIARMPAPTDSFVKARV
ncbi:UTP--glucose-1-phosphate uridylyltransferase GalU [Alicyclobacillus fastidiosus]|uniref:UTP--glucose-1-phosphate uridylyltransferase n=1 Tax=Alicyclobacillus fastidiosus TaxID=392011 RepID=A0ABV5AEX4_9BACL|nr:UTP--glucose-1-phosphate uridylyltransferase GalU [Alicyclobacillus fastidiosus]WEH09483.1 UTP--glucose-1-phosphate uridylyltransferase GalU [Alicyclobacillus fastidiosus]